MAAVGEIDEMTGEVTLEGINTGDTRAFVDLLGAVFEDSPWLVARTADARPFATRDALIAALIETMLSAGDDEKLGLIRAHPDLAGKAARAGALTAASTREQAGAGLDRLSEDEFERFHALNSAYREKFGFPFIIAVRDHDKGSILAAFEARLANDIETEIAQALRNIARIVALRIQDLVAE